LILFLNLLPFSVNLNSGTREVLHGKFRKNIHAGCSHIFKHRQIKVSRTIAMTGTSAYNASFHAAYSPYFFSRSHRTSE
jgi:hypothetical protein